VARRAACDRTLLHPALPSCPGHDVWRRDFTGSASVFSVVLAESATPGQAAAFAEALQLFRIGWSWGGVHSLAVPYPDLLRTSSTPHRGSLVRLNIGLEAPDDLIADLAQGLARAGLPAAF
jgi:cystathionine beta-lyase